MPFCYKCNAPVEGKITEKGDVICEFCGMILIKRDDNYDENMFA